MQKRSIPRINVNTWATNTLTIAYWDWHHMPWRASWKDIFSVEHVIHEHTRARLFARLKPYGFVNLSLARKGGK
jgi:hypothetical protein